MAQKKKQSLSLIRCTLKITSQIIIGHTKQETEKKCVELLHSPLCVFISWLMVLFGLCLFWSTPLTWRIVQNGWKISNGLKFATEVYYEVGKNTWRTVLFIVYFKAKNNQSYYLHWKRWTERKLTVDEAQKCVRVKTIVHVHTNLNKLKSI